MVQLLERFIVAFENFARAYCEAHAIRAALTGEQHACKCAGPKVGDVLPDGGVVVEQMAPPAPAVAQTAAAPEAPNYKGVTDYDTLRRLCQERKIAVPPRTKSTTLVKWLQQDDLAKGTGAAPQAPAAPPVVAAPVVHTDPAPVPAPTPPVEADPFQEPPPSLAKAVTREDVIAAATQLKDLKGLDAVKRVVIEYGGAARITDIPEDKLAIVHAAIKEELK